MPCHSRSARRRVSMQCLPNRCVQFCVVCCVRVRVCVVRVRFRLRSSYDNAFSLENSGNSLGTDMNPLFPAGALPATLRSFSLLLPRTFQVCSVFPKCNFERLLLRGVHHILYHDHAHTCLFASLFHADLVAIYKAQGHT
jgi:hypothetical protein